MRAAGLGLVAALTALPVAAGLGGTLAQALAGDGFARLAAWPGLTASLRLSILTGGLATLASFVLVLAIVGALAGTPGFDRLRHLISPLLALPHAAAALGLAFLVAPSGWIARGLSPWATGWQVPPDLMILNDPWGLSLTLGLIAKETPFVLLMALAALPQTDAARRLTLASSLGYGRMAGFAIGVMPALVRQIRLPLHAVMAYSMTSVDMGMVLGPSLPAPLAVQVLHWAQAPSLADQPTAAAGALLLLAVVAAAVLCCEIAARLLGRGLRALAGAGHRMVALDRPVRAAARAIAFGMSLGLFAGLAGLALWSVAGLWRFPHALPESFSLEVWRGAGADLRAAAMTSLGLGLVSTTVALALALVLLQGERKGRRHPLFDGVIYLPLMLPQVAVVPGMAVAAVRLGWGEGFASVALGHLVFVLPYVALSLADPWRAWDERVAVVAASLGASPARILWQLRLPMLLPAVLTAAAVGLAASVGQYLPTLLLSGGRIPSLTTEALALASGGNRRLIGAYAVLQMALPMLGFALALALPRLVFFNRRGMFTP